ncbi:uncharacterized protein LOC129304871 [Prosopis cineraria]|uniref:uncharacterized protein LOC129304871 n=1 Tax=Prosopis cineraria TaxID=364024 RepID=UPI00240EC24C|nr:uncharacterized protein LOC129304871 [Prosopis cineraria]
MDESVGFGFMAVCAVSGSMVLLVHHVHKHLFSNFMKKIEFEMGGVLRPRPQHNPTVSEQKHEKKLRFCEDASPKNKNDRKKVTRAVMEKERKVLVSEDVHQKWRGGPRLEDIMPPNRAVLYKGIMKYRTRMGKFGF